MISLKKKLSLILALTIALGAWAGLSEEVPTVESLQGLVRLADGWLLQGLEAIYQWQGEGELKRVGDSPPGLRLLDGGGTVYGLNTQTDQLTRWTPAAGSWGGASFLPAEPWGGGAPPGNAGRGH